MRRRLAIAGGVLVVVAAVAAGGFWAIQRFPTDEGDVETDAEPGLTTAAVVRVDLMDEETFEGTLRFADSHTILAQAQGTVTALPPIGAVLGRGDVAFEVDGRPVVVMFGERPAWRPIGAGPSDDPDHEQVIENLDALGFDLGYPYGSEFEDLPPFTTRTSDLVRQWQKEMGLDETGILELGLVLFVTEPVRVADLLVDVGAPIGMGTPVLVVSAEEKEVQLWLDTNRQDLLEVGDSVGLELPDDTTTTGVVSQISRVVTTLGTPQEPRRVVEVTIRLEDAEAAAEFDEAPVDVEVAEVKAADVLAVPVKALLALAEGGYAVEIRDPDGAIRLVAVDIGSFADGLVEVEGDLRQGDLVVVPQ